MGLVLAFGLSLPLTACGTSEHLDAAYEVTYVLNDGSQSQRTVSVVTGATAVDWEPYRAGYVLKGWYTDEAHTQEFDFSARIGQNVTLYALWEKEADKFAVTFNGNTLGSGVLSEIAVRDGDKVNTSKIPVVSKIGFNFEGWYSDKACTDKWNFETDVVTEDITLYANYTPDGSVKYENGKPVYENVTVNLWLGPDFGLGTYLREIAADFNEQYEGQISVNISNDLTSQGQYCLRLQQNPERNKSVDYWSVPDIYDLAGIECDYSQWEGEWFNDSLVNDVLYTVPYGAVVPYVIYNKGLMTKYNGSEPKTYGELCALLTEVCEGEKSNANFKGFISDNGWTYCEATSYAAFAQNGAEYYSFENGVCATGWNNTETAANAVKAFKRTYNLLSPNGGLNGGLTSSYADTFNAVTSGNAFMGIINFGDRTVQAIAAEKEGTIGIMPLSGLFADEDSPYKDRIPVHTIGLSFCKYQSALSNTEIAAAAVFADYASKHSANLLNSAWMPLNKAVLESDEFVNDTTDRITFFKKVGEVKNFYTMNGHTQGKNTVTGIAGQYLLPYLNGTNSNADEMVKELAVVIHAWLAR